MPRCYYDFLVFKSIINFEIPSHGLCTCIFCCYACVLCQITFIFSLLDIFNPLMLYSIWTNCFYCFFTKRILFQEAHTWNFLVILWTLFGKRYCLVSSCIEVIGEIQGFRIFLRTAIEFYLFPLEIPQTFK